MDPLREEEETTDLKLALLSSLHPATDPATLLELLLISNGSVAAASSLLSDPPSPPPPRPSTSQSSLIPFLTAPPTSTPRPPKKGHTLHLYTPAHFAALTPTTLHPAFLPPSLASTLLSELLAESLTFPPPPPFSLFSNTVTSPHTTCLYLRTPSSHPYTYQGATMPATRPFTPSMAAATAAVEALVNADLSTRPRLPGQIPPGEWKVNAALVNCYKGGEQSVGWHADQLTYIGPAAVIASVSLGCTREFRVRRVAGGEEGEEEGAYGLWLPHNSLLVMGAGMQEEWKHWYYPARSRFLE